MSNKGGQPFYNELRLQRDRAVWVLWSYYNRPKDLIADDIGLSRQTIVTICKRMDKREREDS